MPITPRHTARRLHAAQTLLANVTDGLPYAVAAIHAHIDTGGDHERPEDATGVATSGHSDPTGQTAISRLGAYERHLDAVSVGLNALALELGRLADISARWAPDVDMAAIKAEWRCTGGRTIEPWSKPECGELVEGYAT